MHAAAATLRRMNAGRIAHGESIQLRSGGDPRRATDNLLPAPRGARWQSPLRPPPFKKLMAANRGEIALRILRASDEMGIRTVGIFSHEGASSEGWVRHVSRDEYPLGRPVRATPY